MLPLPVVRYLEFQSTLPSRRATNVIWCRKGAHEFQSTLPSRGATREMSNILTPPPYFNPRSPRGERPFGKLHPLRQPGFQSTLPSRGATSCAYVARYTAKFQSTLPSRGATSAQKLPFRGYRNFNPRSPRGERRHIKLSALGILAFQSTLPSRGATGGVLEAAPVRPISIHAPLAGSDAGHGVPGLPAGHSISIHAPLAESDRPPDGL